MPKPLVIEAKARKALAEDAGLLWGIYHFMRPGHIRNQADAFLSKTDLIDDDTLLVCDFEVNGITLDELLEFLTRVEAKSGQKPVLYSGNTLKELGGASTHRELADYRLWIAQYNNKGPTLPKGYKDWWLWQYSDRGKVAGINGSVDVNAYQGTARDLRQNWVIRHSAATASATHESPLVGKTSDSSTGNLTDKAGAADAPTQALNQTIVDVPPVKTEAPESIVSKVKTWYAALPTFVFSVAAAFWSWLQGAAIEIVIAFLATAGIVAIVFLVINFISRNREKQREFEAIEKQKERDFELTKLQMLSAADPNKQTVRLAPPAIELPAPEQPEASQ
jgi:hypothetical protein